MAPEFRKALRNGGRPVAIVLGVAFVKAARDARIIHKSPRQAARYLSDANECMLVAQGRHTTIYL